MRETGSRKIKRVACPLWEEHLYECNKHLYEWTKHPENCFVEDLEFRVRCYGDSTGILFLLTLDSEGRDW